MSTCDNVPEETRQTIPSFSKILSPILHSCGVHGMETLVRFSALKETSVPQTFLTLAQRKKGIYHGDPVYVLR